MFPLWSAGENTRQPRPEISNQSSLEWNRVSILPEMCGGEMSLLWRVGQKVPVNVYEGDRPVCQCHSPEDAALIVASVNALASDRGRVHKTALDHRKTPRQGQDTQC
jgi:hypothetical protein